MKTLHIGSEQLGVIHEKKTRDESKIWLVEKDASWWVVVLGPDGHVRKAGFVRPPQEQRARETFEALVTKPQVLAAFLEGRDS